MIASLVKILSSRYLRPWLLVLVLVFVSPSVAHAHADVVRAEPANNTVLVIAPTEVRVWFNESLSPLFTSLQLLNAKGESITPITLHIDPAQPEQLLLALPDLSPDVYNLVWNVLSDVDGHFSQGHLVFGVGARADLARFSQDEALTIPWGEALLRWVSYGTQMALIGALALLFLIFEPALDAETSWSQGNEVLAETCLRLWVWAVYMALAALSVGIVVLAWQGITSPPAMTTASAVSKPVVLETIWQLVTQTRWGWWWAMRQGILLALLVVTYQRARGALLPVAEASSEIWQAQTKKVSKRKTDGGRRHCEPSADRSFSTSPDPQVAQSTPIWVSGSKSQRTSVLQWALLIGLALGLAVSIALTGHAAALNSGALLAVTATVLHLMAASVWVGGLLALSVALLPLLYKDVGSAVSLPQIGWRAFSRWAFYSVGLVFATGIYSMGRQTASLDALLTTFYGQVLLGKVGLVLGIGVCGLLNSILLRAGKFPPARWVDPWRSRLPTVVLIEVILGFVVLLATGLLTSSSPAHGPQFAPTDSQAEPTTQRRRADNLVVTLAAQPNRPGGNLISIAITETDKVTGSQILRVITRFTYRGQEIGTTSADAIPTGEGNYQVTGAQLSITGPWQIEVVVRRKGVEDIVVGFDWQVAVPAQPVLISNWPLSLVLTPLAVGVLGLFCVGSIILWLFRQPRRLQITSQAGRVALQFTGLLWQQLIRKRSREHGTACLAENSAWRVDVEPSLSGCTGDRGDDQRTHHHNGKI